MSRASHRDNWEAKEVTRRLLGSSSIVTYNPGDRDVAVSLDVEGLVRRLILFDTYVLYSVRLKEIPEMVRHFGFQGTLDLLSSGAIKLRCECIQFAEGEFNTPACPPLTFQFHVIDTPNWEEYLISNLAELRQAPGLGSRELMDLQGAVVAAVAHFDNRQMFFTDVGPTFEGEVIGNKRLLKAAVLSVIGRQANTAQLDLDLVLEKVGEDRYRAETNLQRILGISEAETHDIIKKALLGIAGLAQRIGEMKAHSAISGFIEDDLPLFEAKLGPVAGIASSDRQEERFLRVISIATRSAPATDVRIDVEKLLRIRDEPEGLEFRSWLTDTDKLSESEIRERIAGVDARLSLLVHSTRGKVLRLAAKMIAASVPPLGMALSAMDQFLWDRFLRKSGVAAFVNDLYPSVFRASR